MRGKLELATVKSERTQRENNCCGMQWRLEGHWCGKKSLKPLPINRLFGYEQERNFAQTYCACVVTPSRKCFVIKFSSLT